LSLQRHSRLRAKVSGSGRLRTGTQSRAPGPSCTFPKCRTSSHCCRSVTDVRVESLRPLPLSRSNPRHALGFRPDGYRRCQWPRCVRGTAVTAHGRSKSHRRFGLKSPDRLTPTSGGLVIDDDRPKGDPARTSCSARGLPDPELDPRSPAGRHVRPKRWHRRCTSVTHATSPRL